eukprot:11372933-Karenia_brevis.AAC.1
MGSKDPRKILDAAEINWWAETLRRGIQACPQICDWTYAILWHPVLRVPGDLVEFPRDQLEARPLRNFRKWSG